MENNKYYQLAISRGWQLISIAPGTDIIEMAAPAGIYLTLNLSDGSFELSYFHGVLLLRSGNAGPFDDDKLYNRILNNFIVAYEKLSK